MSAHRLSHKIFRGSIAREAQRGETRITWDNKSLRLQVSPREMCDVLAALLGYMDDVEFKHHGRLNAEGA